MKIGSIALYQYSLELIRPLISNGQTLNTREGLLLHLRCAEGAEGFVEIAPLPGVSMETLGEALGQVRSVGSYLSALDIPENVKDITGTIAKQAGGIQIFPSVSFGIESAVSGLLANARRVSLSQFMSSSAHPQVAVTGLLNGTGEGITSQTRDLLEKGFKDLKLKIANDPEEAARQVAMVNEAAYGKALLHLDVNRAWDFQTALDFGKKITCAAVNYIEEPFADTQRIPEFFDQTMIPVALDESLSRLNVDAVRHISGVDVLVLKPTVLGGIERTLAIIHRAEGCALKATVSSSFESSLGLSVLADLAGAAPHVNISAGLDTLKWFKEDLLKEPVRIEGGAIRTRPRAVSSGDVNFDRLQKISSAFAGDHGHARGGRRKRWYGFGGFRQTCWADEPGEAPTRKFWSEDGSFKRYHAHARGAP